MRPHYSHSSRENATPSNGTSPLGSCKGVPPPGKKVRGKIATENDWDKMALSSPLQRQNRK